MAYLTNTEHRNGKSALIRCIPEAVHVARQRVHGVHVGSKAEGVGPCYEVEVGVLEE